jgi:two-component system, NtrC family, sensor histidine kinase HydH
MSLEAQTALLAAILSLTLGVNLVFRRRGDSVAVWYAAFTGNLFLWWVALFLAHLQPTSTWLTLMLICNAALPISSLGFYRRLLVLGGDTSRASWRSWRVAIAFSLFALIFPFVAPFFSRTSLFTVELFSRVMLLAAMGLGLYFVFRRTRLTPSRVEAVRLLYVFIGGVITSFLLISDLFTRAGLGDVLAAVYLYLLSQTILRQRLLEIKEILGKMAALGIEAAMIAAMYTTLTSPAWLAEDLGLFALNGLVAAVVFLLLVDLIRERVDEWVSRQLFRETVRLEKEIVELTKHLARVIEPQEMANQIVTALERTDRATHATVYVVDARGMTRLQKLGPEAQLLLNDPAARPVLDRISRGEVLLTDVIDTRRDNIERGVSFSDKENLLQLSELSRALRGLEAGVVVPFFRDRRLLGCLILRDDRLKEAYSREELQMLRDLAAQAALIIENSQLYAQQKQRDRLAAIGEMSAGLAHEVRNPLGAIKGAAQLVQNSQELSQTKEFLQIIVEEVDRLDAVVGKFLDYARPLHPSLQPIDITQVIKRSAALLGELSHEVELETDFEEPLPTCQGDPELLTQVFLNLLQNACQAMNGQGKLGISVKTSEAQKLLICRVEDTGPGISPETLVNLFVPFFTTKERGTGLGLAISQRIIEKHGGIISARSVPGQGATFLVKLPY